MSVRRSINPRKPSGFTLIELLVVVGILVALAGSLLPKLDRIDQKTNKGIAANNMAGTSRYIQTYRILHNVYPDKWDSLVDASGNLAKAATPDGPGLEPQTTGGTADGQLTSGPHKLTTFTLDAAYVRSLNRMNIATVLDWDASTGGPGNISGGGGAPTDLFNTPRGIAGGGKFATIDNTDGDGKDIINQIYPANKLPSYTIGAATIPAGVSGVTPPGKQLIVFGFGPLNQCIGDVIQDCPAYSNTDSGKFYTRFLAVFEANDGGSRCELKLVVGADGDLTRDEMNDFYE